MYVHEPINYQTYSVRELFFYIVLQLSFKIGGIGVLAALKSQFKEIFYFVLVINGLQPLTGCMNAFGVWLLRELLGFLVDSPCSIIAERQYSLYNLVRRIATLCILYFGEFLFK
jgi:hypothetical protein